MGSGSDWIRAKTREVLKGFLSHQPGNISQPALNQAEYITFTNGQKTKGKTDSGIEVDVIPQGRLRTRELGIMVGPKQFLCKGPNVRYKTIDGSISLGFLILEANNPDGDGRRHYYVGKLTKNSMVLYEIDIFAIMGITYSPTYSGNFFEVRFSADGKHIFAGEIGDVSFSGSADDPLSNATTIVKHFGWGLNFSLSGQAVSFTSINSSSFSLKPGSTLPLPEPPTPPGVPVNAVTNEVIPDDTTVFEAENDPEIISRGNNSEAGFFSYNYVHKFVNNVPVSDILGLWSVDRHRSSVWRVASSSFVPLTRTYGAYYVDPDTGQGVRPFTDNNGGPPETFYLIEGFDLVPSLPVGDQILAAFMPLPVEDGGSGPVSPIEEVGENLYRWKPSFIQDSLYGASNYWTNAVTKTYSCAFISGSFQSEEVYSDLPTWTSYVDNFPPPNEAIYGLLFELEHNITGSNYANTLAFRSIPINNVDKIANIGGTAVGGVFGEATFWVHPAITYFSTTPNEEVGPSFERRAFTDTHYFDVNNQPSEWSLLQVKSRNSEVFQTFGLSGSEATVQEWRWDYETNAIDLNKTKIGVMTSEDVSTVDWYVR